MNSEELKKLAAEEDNDLKHLGIARKAYRQSKLETFQKNYLNKLKSKRIVVEANEGQYTITDERFGQVDFYPKSDKLLIRKYNQWVRTGLNWIIKNIINGN